MDEMFFYESRQPVFDKNDEIRCKVKTKPKGKKINSKRNVVACGVAIVLTLVLLGIGLGFWICRLHKTVIDADGEDVKDKARQMVVRHEDIASLIDKREIEKHLRHLTKHPHIAGSLRNRELALYIKNKWQNEYGIEAKLIRYDVLLSFPSNEKPSAVQLINSKDTVNFTTQHMEKALEASERQSGVLPPFAAYSPSGNVTADMIYVNYGRAEDFEYLLKRNVSCRGKIVIVRYGGNFRGDKVRLAHEHGAIGVIVYSDPADSAPILATYPRSKYLPCTGVQRGAFGIAHGDPETPGYPSIDGIYRVTNSRKNLPKIPVHPISACDALQFFSKLKRSISTPHAWQGGLNISYNIGPGFENSYKKWKVRLEVYTEEKRENIYNVEGTIRGAIEPDRRVIIGNHRDAWVYGGVDPSGGTACLMEISRALGRAMKSGWRPRRTIMLMSWGAEEYGMIGSTEYVEEFSRIIREEGVAYLNLDSPIRGNFSIFVKSSPMLYDVFYNAAAKVKNPVNNKESVFDQWLRNFPSTTTAHPRVYNIATGSDYMAFNQQLGIPSAEIRYVASKDNFGYPVYHSLHDTFHYVKTYMDPDFLTHRAIAQVMAFSVLALADDELLPMNATKYAEKLSFGVKALVENHGDALRKYNITPVHLEKAIESFEVAALELDKEIFKVKKNEILKLRMLNDKVMTLEKGFVSDANAFGVQQTRHVIFGLNSQNSYNTVQFPGLINALMQKTSKKSLIEEQLNILMTHIQNVANYLKGV